MKIDISSRNHKVSESTKEYAAEKVSRLSRYFEGVHKCEVILQEEANRNRVELIVSAALGNTFVAHEAHEDMYAAIDLALDKMEKQLRRFKEKLKGHRARAADQAAPPGPAGEHGEPLDSYDDVVRRMDEY
ncbi:MAG: ribosome-associated translation inhibitor RaiA [Planctomycetes bacterium]|nr:ribosome-associated translation inhibitor RaiA [Planctomycetota bacterium]